jgi:hypothetical protein
MSRLSKGFFILLLLSLIFSSPKDVSAGITQFGCQYTTFPQMTCAYAIWGYVYIDTNGNHRIDYDTDQLFSGVPTVTLDSGVIASYLQSGGMWYHNYTSETSGFGPNATISSTGGYTPTGDESVDYRAYLKGPGSIDLGYTQDFLLSLTDTSQNPPPPPPPPGPYDFISGSPTTGCSVVSPSEPYVRLDWTTSTNANTYTIFRDGSPIAADWPNNIYIDTQANQRNHTYSYYVVAYGQTSPPFTSSIKSVTTGSCPNGTTSGPTITELNVKNSTATSFVGTSNVSGNQSTVTEGGSGWLNPMAISLKVTPGTAPNIKQTFVVFYKNSGLPQDILPNSISNLSSFLLESQNRLSDPIDGFLVAYGTQPECTTSCSTGYFIWDPILNSWKIVTSTYLICGGASGVRDCAAKSYFRVTRPTDSNPNSWIITYSKTFGSKKLYTGAYAVDENNLVDFVPDMNPTP